MKNSIKKQSDFNNLYRKGKSHATKNIVLYVLKNSVMERNRYGISVSRKVGNSVVRHTLIRRIREIIRQNEAKLTKGYDLSIILRIGSEKEKYTSLNDDFLKLCRQHGILEEED